MSYQNIIPALCKAYTDSGRPTYCHMGDGLTEEQLQGIEDANALPIRIIQSWKLIPDAPIMRDSFGSIEAGLCIIHTGHKDPALAVNAHHEMIGALFYDRTTNNQPMTAPTGTPFDFFGVQVWRFRPRSEIDNQARSFGKWYMSETLFEYAIRKI